MKLTKIMFLLSIIGSGLNAHMFYPSATGVEQHASMGCFAVLRVYLTLSFSPTWADSVNAGRCWIALTLVILGNWNPDTIVFGAICLGPEKSVTDLDLQVDCGRCVQVCREGALSFVLTPEVDFVNNLIAEVEALTDTT